ncbi:uncharacterized protein LOC136083541 [Hydra vulgaris]|uniref:Uncharacterized protein LOC136083541 n=1 Tax=Hydra vulgaris TaxID=6087 RepID=A0ABM4CBG6_HYDVU
MIYILAELEDRSRRNNLRFCGIEEIENESWEDGESKVREFLNNKLQLHGNFETEMAHRVSKKLPENNEKNRSIRTWFIIREITGNKKSTSHPLPNMVKHNNKFLYDKRQITEEFNKYFVSVGPNLAKNIPIANSLMIDLCFLFNSYLNSFELSFEEFKIAFKMLKSNKAVCPDGIKRNIIISSFDVLKDILFKIISISIKQGVFPQALNLTKVIPILKGGYIENISNYRPISLLSVFSKVLKEFCVFIDLAKAFDTIDHKILFKKLEWY